VPAPERTLNPTPALVLRLGSPFLAFLGPIDRLLLNALTRRTRASGTNDSDACTSTPEPARNSASRLWSLPSDGSETSSKQKPTGESGVLRNESRHESAPPAEVRADEPKDRPVRV
jgi:hypothetical protein